MCFRLPKHTTYMCTDHARGHNIYFWGPCLHTQPIFVRTMLGATTYFSRDREHGPSKCMLCVCDGHVRHLIRTLSHLQHIHNAQSLSP